MLIVLESILSFADVPKKRKFSYQEDKNTLSHLFTLPLPSNSLSRTQHDHDTHNEMLPRSLSTWPQLKWYSILLVYIPLPNNYQYHPKDENEMKVKKIFPTKNELKVS